VHLELIHEKVEGKKAFVEIPIQDAGNRHVNMDLRDTVTSAQGVAKRWRLSWLANSALAYEPKCGRGGWGEEVVAGSQLSQ
jgi:hypothetical protein